MPALSSAPTMLLANRRVAGCWAWLSLLGLASSLKGGGKSPSQISQTENNSSRLIMEQAKDVTAYAVGLVFGCVWAASTESFGQTIRLRSKTLNENAFGSRQLLHTTSSAKTMCFFMDIPYSISKLFHLNLNESHIISVVVTF